MDLARLIGLISFSDETCNVLLLDVAVMRTVGGG